METYKGKAKNNVLAYIIKTEKNERVAIFYQDGEARRFLMELIERGCNLNLHIEELT